MYALRHAASYKRLAMMACFTCHPPHPAGSITAHDVKRGRHRSLVSLGLHISGGVVTQQVVEGVEVTGCGGAVIPPVWVRLPALSCNQ